MLALTPDKVTYFPLGQFMTHQSEGEPFTPHPNHIDAILTAKAKTLAEMKIVNVVIRKTLGYHKTWDTISFSQFEELTQMNPQGVCNGIQAALERGFIVRTRAGQGWQYSLNYPYFESFITTQECGVVNNEVLQDIEYLPLHDVETQKKDLNKNTNPNGLGELHSQTTAPNILEFIPTDSPPDKASQSTFFSESIPVDLKAKKASRGKAQLKPEKKAKSSPSWQDDPRFVIWRKYADIKHYKPWPNAQERELIVQHIPPDSENLERWEGLIIIWLDREHNYKIFNIAGLVDVFLNGFREKNYSKRGQYR